MAVPLASGMSRQLAVFAEAQQQLMEMRAWKASEKEDSISGNQRKLTMTRPQV